MGPTTRALKGIFLGSITTGIHIGALHCYYCYCLILNRLQLSDHYVHLGITNGVDVAVHVSRARGRSFDLKMHAICGVDKLRSVAMQCCVGTNWSARLITTAKWQKNIKKPLPLPTLQHIGLGALIAALCSAGIATAVTGIGAFAGVPIGGVAATTGISSTLLTGFSKKYNTS